MKSIFKKSIFALLFGATLLTNSCTNLDEEIFSEVTKDNYYNNADEVIAALLRPWGHFCGVMQVAQASWSCNELSADAAAWPQKGVHGLTTVTGLTCTVTNGLHYIRRSRIPGQTCIWESVW